MKKFLQKYSDIKNLYPLRYIIFGEIFAILLYNINIQRGTNANTFLENEMRNSNLNNNYHIVLASDENIKYLEDFLWSVGMMSSMILMQHALRLIFWLIVNFTVKTKGLKVG